MAVGGKEKKRFKRHIEKETAVFNKVRMDTIRRLAVVLLYFTTFTFHRESIWYFFIIEAIR